MKMRALLAVSLVATLGAVLVSGCCIPSSCSDQIGQQIGKEVEKQVEKNTGVDVNTEKTTEATGEDLKSVPRYPDATRTLYIKGEPIDGNISISITYETKDAPAKVSSWYKDKMASLGWTISMTVAGTDGGEMITYDKGDDNTTATVNVSKSDSKTAISVMYNGAASGA